MISNALTLGLFPKSTPGRDLLDFSLEPGSLMSGCWVECRKCCHNFLMDYHLRFFFGAFKYVGGIFCLLQYECVNPFWLIYLLKVQNNHLVVWNIWNEGMRFFCSSIKGFDPISKGRSFLPENGLPGKTLWISCCFFSPYMHFTTYNELGQGILVGFTGGFLPSPKLRKVSRVAGVTCFSRKIMTCHHLHWLDHVQIPNILQIHKKSSDPFLLKPQLNNKVIYFIVVIIVVYTTLVGGLFTAHFPHFSHIGFISPTIGALFYSG